MFLLFPVQIFPVLFGMSQTEHQPVELRRQTKALSRLVCILWICTATVYGVLHVCFMNPTVRRIIHVDMMNTYMPVMYGLRAEADNKHQH